MPVEHPEHQVIQDVRLHRGYDERVPTEEVAKVEALQMALLPPVQREIALRDFDNKATDYDQTAWHQSAQDRARCIGFAPT